MHITYHIIFMTITKISSQQLAPDCYDFWTKWSSCPPMSQFPHSESACFKSNDKTYVLLNYEVDTYTDILCDYSIVEFKDLFTCLGINHLNTISFDNCVFSTYSVREVLNHIRPKEIAISYNKTKNIGQDLIFHSLAETEVIIITGARSLKNISIHFDDIPLLHTISLYETDYSFSASRLRMLPSLKNFASCKGSLYDIPQGFFNESTSLLHINLGYNCLSDLPSGIFSALHTIYTIRLNHNRFTSIKGVWFNGLNSLLYLDLSYNRLASIPDDLFSSARNIEVFNISSNHRVELSESSLQMAKNLVELRADNCSLTSILPNLLKNVSRLSIFSVSQNDLIKLPPSLFSNQRILKNISLASNRLISIPGSLFSNLDALYTLLIHNNELGWIENGTFSGLFNLVELDLHSNKLEALNSSVFVDLKKLHFLDLSRNCLKYLPNVNPFGPSKYLQLINVSHNALSEFPSIDWKLHDIMTLDCDYNAMTTVILHPLGKKGTKVTLRSNPINTIKMSQDNVEDEFVRFFIQNSTLVCNCDLQGFLSFIGTSTGREVFVKVNHVKCSNPKEWSYLPVTEVVPVHLVCPLNVGCPSFCHCFVTVEGNVLTNCSYLQIKQPPKLIPTGTTILHLENNNITSLSNVDSQSWSNLTDLYLSNNSLLSLKNWTVPSNLHTLAINENKLTDLPFDLMERVDVSPQFKIYIAGNDWRCNCDSVPLKKWFARNKHKILDYNTTQCTRNTRENNNIKSLIRDTPVDLFCPVLKQVFSSQITAISASVVPVALLLICFAIGYYRYNNTIKAFLYSHNLYFHCCEREDTDEDKAFSAFVCYSTVDREIVMAMIRELEPAHRLCIHERDWLPGYPISHHIINSVQNSRKTLLLVSKDFLGSIWFQVEFRTAYNQMLEDKMHRLVLILIGEIGDVSHLETDLRHLISTKTYLQWGEKWFWEKLRYSLRGNCAKQRNEVPMYEKRDSCNVEGFVEQSTTVSTVS